MVFRKRAEGVLTRIQDELQVLIERAQAPEDVREFLLDRWARLLAGISLGKGEQNSDWLAGWETVHALLWSLAPKQGAEDAGRLLQLLPLLVERLHDGCQALHVDKDECDAFFSHLAMLHAATLRAGTQPESLSIEAAHAHDFSETVAIARRDADANAQAEPDTRLAGVDVNADALLDAMRPGSAIDFADGEGQRRLSLQWVSPMHGMFLFSDAEGFAALSLTRGKLREKLLGGSARPVPA